MTIVSILNEPQHEKYAELLQANLVGKVDSVPTGAGTDGIYAFFDGENCVYVGRTNRKSLRARMKQHCSPHHNRAVLAFNLARKKLGIERAYQGEHTRKNLMGNDTFLSEFKKKIDYVKTLDVYFVEIHNADEQYLFEYYAAKSLGSPNNNFGTH